MKYSIVKYIGLVGALLLGGCNDWLDVDPKSQIKQEVLFESEAGFRDALTGIYTVMARKQMYGGNETMGFLDTSLIFGVLPHTHTGNSFGQMQPCASS